MRKWIPVAIGLVVGVLAGLWYGQQPASSLPWFANAVGFIAGGVAKMLGGVFSGGSEWSGIEFLYPMFLTAWAVIGGSLGFVARWILTRKRDETG
jgi:hypothetical protein